MLEEIEVKTERLARLVRESHLDGILLTTQRNFSWLTGGASNRIDGSREAGAGALLVSADGRRFVIANTIEMPRLADEALVGLGFAPLDFPWAAEHADPSTVVKLAASALNRTEGAPSIRTEGTSPNRTEGTLSNRTGGAPPNRTEGILSNRMEGAPANRTEGTPLGVPRVPRLGCDGPLPDTIALEPSIARLRAPLTAEELQRYRTLGREIGIAMGDLCRALTPGQSEIEIASDVVAATARVGARAVVTLVGADDRIAQYRHPVPTETRWTRLVLVAVCAERHGLIVSLSRLVSAGPVASSIAERTRATASVFGRLLAASRPDVSGADIFAAVVDAYAREGFPGEELRHHQGGPIGYRTREWLAHPRSTERLRAPQAVAWNPTVTGTKIEETALVTDAGVEIMTSSPAWPSIDVRVHDQIVAAPDILELPS